jgi:hypothetical protein
MDEQEIQSIAMCLRKRVVPRDAEEGAALCALAVKLVKWAEAGKEAKKEPPKPSDKP